MKAKYNKMIDEYVKKKYGDLDRGVLSPEVKYKVLFKIYRKKHRKEKTLRKSLEKMHRYAPTVLPKEDGFDQLADKAITLCNSTSYMDWLHDDITWCCRECSDMNCERNMMNRKMTTGLISMADMFDPFKCPVDAEIPIDKKDKKC